MNKLLVIVVVLLAPIILFSQENDAISCSDGIDNDGDGLIDCEDSGCANLPNDGCQTCLNDGFSFADFVISSNITCTSNSNDSPQGAIGVSDYTDHFQGEDVSLGDGGTLTLGFSNNLIGNSGNASPDIWVFEVGQEVEPTRIELHPYDQNTLDILVAEGISDPDFDGYYSFGSISGATSFIDIDAVVSGYPYSELRFDAIQLTDLAGACGGSTPGADIDAVCALSSIDCEGVRNGTAVIDECGECLDPDDPLFNMTCLDCAGVINGTSVIDQCGECLDPSDPLFDITCLDCEGTINGLAVIDECGECLEPDDPNFNQSCADCMGIPNGTAIYDDCGVCIELLDPNFNLSCGLQDKIFIPNVFTPNSDGLNDEFAIFKSDKISATINKYQIFSRWGEMVFESNNFDFSSESDWWKGEFKGEKMNPGVFAYFIEVEYRNGSTKRFTGDVTLLH